VGRRVQVALADRATRPVLAAALLHDVGKTDSGLGTFGRVAATLVGRVLGPSRTSPSSRVGRYLRHDELGAALLGAAGSDPLVVSWAARHHRRGSPGAVPAEIAEVLAAADDD